MRYTTFVRKYEQTRDMNMNLTVRKQVVAELNRTIKKAVNNWLLTNHHLGNAKTFQEWNAGWKRAEYKFTLHPNNRVEVTLYADDFCFAQGNTTKILKTFTINKKELFV